MASIAELSCLKASPTTPISSSSCRRMKRSISSDVATSPGSGRWPAPGQGYFLMCLTLLPALSIGPILFPLFHTYVEGISRPCVVLFQLQQALHAGSLTMTIATVIAITGQAWARDADGNLRELRVGDTLQEGETLVTGDNARVQLDFGDGLGPTEIDGGQQVAMTPELDSSQPAEASEFSALDEDLEALLAAIDEGEGDLLDALDATAAGAGPGGGADGGHSFVMLGRIAEQVSPLSFDYGMGQLAAIDFPEDVAQELEEGEDFGVSISGLTLEGADLTVDEANLGNGSNPDAGALIQTGSFTISAPDGIATLSVGGAFIVQNGVLQSLPSITTEAGNVLAITGYTNNGDGTYTVEYSYTLNGAKDHSAPGDDSSLDQVFVVNVVDTDGDSATANLTIAVLDDGPVATDDSVTQAAENQPVDIDVFDNDTAGADGVNLATGVALVADSLTGAGSLVYNEDGTFTYTPAAGEEGEVSFQYTITDADGDSDTATATITLQDNSQPTVSVVLAQGDDGVVSESALPDGSGGGDLTASGTLVAETGNDTLDFFEVQDVNGAWIKVDADGTEVQGEI